MTDDQLSRSDALDSTSPSTTSTASPQSTTNDPESTTLRTAIYTAEESVTEAVVEAVSSVSGVDPIDLEPLYYTIDPDALESVFESRPCEGDLPRDVEVSFSYVGLQVTVTAAGQIIVEDEGPDVD